MSKCDCDKCWKIYEMEAEIARLRKALEHIIGMAGAPDAYDGCRNVIARASAVLRAAK